MRLFKQFLLYSIPILLYIIIIACLYFYNNSKNISEHILITDKGQSVILQTYTTYSHNDDINNTTILVFLCSNKKHILFTFYMDIENNPQNEIYFEHYGSFENVEAYYLKFKDLDSKSGIQSSYFHIFWLDEKHDKFCGSYDHPPSLLRKPVINSEAVLYYDAMKDFYLNRIEYELDYNYKIITENSSLKPLPISPVVNFFKVFDEPLGAKLDKRVKDYYSDMKMMNR